MNRTKPAWRPVTPKQFDKEHLRLWLGRQGYRGDGPSPELSDDIVAEVSARYISAYERLTGNTFVPGAQPPADRVAKNVSACFGVNQ